MAAVEDAGRPPIPSREPVFLFRDGRPPDRQTAAISAGGEKGTADTKRAGKTPGPPDRHTHADTKLHRAVVPGQRRRAEPVKRTDRPKKKTAVDLETDLARHAPGRRMPAELVR